MADKPRVSCAACGNALLRCTTWSCPKCGGPGQAEVKRLREEVERLREHHRTMAGYVADLRRHVYQEVAVGTLLPPGMLAIIGYMSMLVRAEEE